jgi:hypothetical protein
MTREDEEQLRLLRLGHYIVAGLLALAGFFPVFHIAMGIWMLRAPEATKPNGGPPMALFAGFFILFGLLWMLTSWALAACLVVAGNSLKERRRRTFCLVVAGVAALMCMPFGTVLGVFTIILLLRPSVRDAFESGTIASEGNAG